MRSWILALVTLMAASSLAQSASLSYLKLIGPKESANSRLDSTAPADNQGSFYAVGVAGVEVQVVKYDRFGNLVDSVSFVEPRGETLPAPRIYVDKAFRPWVVHWTKQGDGRASRIVQLSTSLDVLGSTILQPVAGVTYAAAQMAFDSLDRPIVAATSYNTPLQVDNDVYVYALDKNSLSQRWAVAINRTTNDRLNTLSVGSGDQVYVGMQGTTNPAIKVLNAGTGAEITTYEYPSNDANHQVVRVVPSAVAGFTYAMVKVSSTEIALIRADSNFSPPSISASTRPAAGGTDIVPTSNKVFFVYDVSSNRVIEQTNLDLTAPVVKSIPGSVSHVRLTADASRIFIASLYTDPNTFITEYCRYYSVSNFDANPTIHTSTNPMWPTSVAATVGTEIAMVSSSSQQADIQSVTLSGIAWQFSERYQAHENRSPIHMEVDSAGNIFVLYFAMSSLATEHNVMRLVCLAPNSTELWSRDFNASNGSFDIGADGQPVMVHRLNDGVVRLTKLSSLGGVLWETSVSLPGVSISQVAVNSQNEIAVQAQAPWFLNTFDVVTYRFSPSGALRWRRIYHGDGNDLGRGLVLTNANYVVAALGIGGTTRSGRSVTYDPAGNLVEERDRAPGTWAGSKTALSGGLVVVAHLFQLANNNYQFLLERFNPVTGQTIQSSVLTGNTTPPTFDIATSPAGTVYLAQQAATSRGLVQYNSSGAQAWVRTLPSGVSQIVDLQTDLQNSVYVMALEDYTEGTDSKQGWYLVKYNTLGTLLWQQRVRTVSTELDANPTVMQMGQNFALVALGRYRNTAQGPTVAVANFAQPVPPTVAGENFTVARNQTLTVNAPGVLANDSDLNGDTISAAIVSNPLQGTLTLQPTGAFTYVAPANTGTFNFKYRVIDSTGRSAIAQANITVN